MRMARILPALLALLFPVANGVRGQTVVCSSDDGAKHSCAADTRDGARLVKQRSSAPCKQGDSWGYDERGIWVDHGCSGEFALGPETATESAPKLITCSSDGGKKYCDAYTGHGVRLVKQHSEAPCKQDSSWGYDGLGIWVDHGCSADFSLGQAAQTPGSGAEASGKEAGSGEPAAKDTSCLKAVGKQRADQLVKQCLKVSAAAHPPCNAENSCEQITEEIRRSCGLLGRDAPAFCGGYK